MTPTFEENLRKACNMAHVGRREFTIHSDAPQEQQDNWWLLDLPTLYKNIEQLINQNYVSKEAVVEALNISGDAEEYSESVRRGYQKALSELRTKLLGKETKFKGTVSEVKRWNRKLTSPEVNDLFDKETKGTDE